MLSKFPSVSTRCKKKKIIIIIIIIITSELIISRRASSTSVKFLRSYERLTDKHLSVRIGIQITKILKYNYMQ